MDSIDKMLAVVERLGFPVAVTIFLLWRYETRLKEIGEAMQKIATTLAVIAAHDDDDGGPK
jgi:hypothetical protein